MSLLKLIKTFVFVVGLTNLSFAQFKQMDSEDVQKKFEELMKNRERLFQSLLNDDSFAEMEKRMDEMMKSFGDDESFFYGNNFLKNKIIGEYDWKEDETHKILTLKVKQIKDQPLDIKIEKGHIRIKGTVEETQENGKKAKRVSKVQFERVFSIPQGVDEKNPEFENKDKEMLIKFKKIRTTSTKKSPPKLDYKQKTIEDERIPVTPGKDDISI